MRIKLDAALALILLASSHAARAEWKITASEVERSPNQLVGHWTTKAEDSETNSDATLHLAAFDSRVASLRVIDQPESPRQELAAVVAGSGALAGVNGGYFDPEDAPVGLLVSEGRVLSPLRKAKLLTGILFANANRIDIVRANHFSSKQTPRSAVQCGPLLLEDGEPVAGLNDSKIARRTFAAVDGKGRAVLGISSGVSLAQLSQILRLTNNAGSFRVVRALNLDGGSSTGFWFASDHGPVSIPEQKTVRDFVTVVPRVQTRP